MFGQFFKKLLCKHQWRGSGFSYARCEKCDKSKYAPEIARAEINKYCNSMIDAALWSDEDVNKEKAKRGMD